MTRPLSPNLWLMKSEPDAYSIDDLKRDKKTLWDGIRNYQVRNLIRDEMKEGDLAIFYHSNAKPPAVVGLMKIAGKPTPDPLQFDSKSKYYDPKSKQEMPRWLACPCQFVEKFKQPVDLATLRKTTALRNMKILSKGNRLSITRLTLSEFKTLLKMAAAQFKV